MNTTFHPPREGDLPLPQLIATADHALETHPNAEVYFKYTCKHCGQRCEFEEPNRLYESGTCHACGKETMVLFGGFTLKFTL